MTGPALVAAVLLAWAGGAKMWRPGGTARAVAMAGAALAARAGRGAGRRLERPAERPAVRALRPAVRALRPAVRALRPAVRALVPLVPLVRGLAALELLVATAAVVVGGPWLVAMGCSYAAFAVFIGAARRWRWPLSSCGCFGVTDGQPSLGHLAADVALAVASLAAAADGVRPLATITRHPAEGAALALLAAVISGLVVLVVSVLPTVVTR